MPLGILAFRATFAHPPDPPLVDEGEFNATTGAAAAAKAILIEVLSRHPDVSWTTLTLELTRSEG